MKRLIRYSETPQITGLEYDELSYLKSIPKSEHSMNELLDTA